MSVAGAESRRRPPVRRPRRSGGLHRLGVLDPLEAVALVARERRELLLATYGQRLGREELEDCYSQATLEMLARARRSLVDGEGKPFACREHIANALEQRLCSRIQDRHRALGGRSPIEAAMARALPIAVCGERSRSSVRGLIDERADVERIALLREELERIARFSRELTRDQRVLLAGQLSGQTPSGFCAEHGWSLEKYRKVGQRARAHLNRLLAADSAVPAAPPVSLTAPVSAAPAVPVAGHGRISTQGPAYEIHSPTT
jgi:hypothetical protein